MSIEAVVLGRVGIDLYPDELRTPLRDVRHYTRYVGGFAGNLSTGLARLGVRTAIVSRVGDDGHGEFVRAFLEAEGVDCRFLAVDPDWRHTPDLLRDLAARRLPAHLLPRVRRLPDWQLQPGRLRRGRSRGGAGSLRDRHRPRAVAQPRDDARCAARRTAAGRRVFDLDWRPSLWDDPVRTATLAREAAGARRRRGREPRRGRGRRRLDAVLELAPTVILKRGGDGAVLDDGELVDVPGVPVEVVNGLGAGDAFGAAVGYAIVRGIGLRGGCRAWATAPAPTSRSGSPCSEAMPTPRRPPGGGRVVTLLLRSGEWDEVTPESAGWDNLSFRVVRVDGPGLVRPRRARGRDRPGLGRRDGDGRGCELGGGRPQRTSGAGCRARCTCRATRRSRSRARPSWRSAARVARHRYQPVRDPARGRRDRGARLRQRDAPDLAHRPARVPAERLLVVEVYTPVRQLVELPAAQARRGPRRRRR